MTGGPETVLPAFPPDALVVFIGASGSGKSTFARAHFRPTQVVSSDACRAMVADNEADQAATPAAFAVLQCVVEQRLRAGRLTVVDATNVQQRARRPLLALAARYHRPAIAILFQTPAAICKERNRQRADRTVHEFVVDRQQAQAPAGPDLLRQEGFQDVIVVGAVEKTAEKAAVGASEPSVPSPRAWQDRTGPFDVIGDVHGCCEELLSLLRIMGYGVSDPAALLPRITPPVSRTAVFLGDFVDHGPQAVRTLLVVASMVRSGAALAVLGNHDDKLLRALRGAPIQPVNGLDRTLQELDAAGAEMKAMARSFLGSLPTHLVLDGGQLVVAHAGLPQELQGSTSPQARQTALFGTPTGQRNQYGMKILVDWASSYTGEALVVWGHIPVDEAHWVGNTIDIDTGCVHGGSLTALRYPERELVSVPAKRVYAVCFKQP